MSLLNMRFAGAWMACYSLCFGCAAGVLLAVHAALEPAQQMRFSEALSSAAGLLVVLSLLLLAATGFLAQWIIHTYFKPLAQLTESVRLIASSNPALRANISGTAALRQLAQAVNLLAEKRKSALTDVDARIKQAHANLDEERNRLAALMSELAQSVIVCNTAGRILLYNQRARELFAGANNGANDTNTKAAPAYIGLGRSLFSVIERDLFVHSVEQLELRIAQGEARPVAEFMIPMAANRMLRARMAPVMADDGKDSPSREALSGHVLLLQDVSDAVIAGEQRDQLQQRLVENARAAIANIRAAVENILNYPDADAARRHQFTAIINEEAHRLGAELDRATREHSDYVKRHWSLDQMRAADLVALIRRRIESQYGMTTRTADVANDVWVNADSYTLMLAVCHLAHQLREMMRVKNLRFRATASVRHVHIEMAWHGAPLPAAAARAWQDDAAGVAGSLSVNDILQRHNGEAWYENDLASAYSMFRILLPLAAAGKALAARREQSERPEYYDFDLFNQPGQTRALDDLPLNELTYTVFDTETTGLEPSAGDEIISIGAVRIVNNRVLAAEIFDQLVDPQRPLTAASMKIHGIRPEMLHGQPAIAPVLAAFQRFCEDTVLVGHNAAFDLRFLQLKEAATGVRFTHPVLDTLLLSAVLHGDLESHALEAIAARYGISVVGRHTAVGDAILTAEIFVKMIPLLAARGILTLRQAREASQKTYYARIRY